MHLFESDNVHPLPAASVNACELPFTVPHAPVHSLSSGTLTSLTSYPPPPPIFVAIENVPLHILLIKAAVRTIPEFPAPTSTYLSSGLEGDAEFFAASSVTLVILIYLSLKAAKM